MAPLIHNLGTSVRGQLHRLAALPLGKEPPYLLNRRLCGPQDRSEHFGDSRKSLSFLRHSHADRPAHIPVDTDDKTTGYLQASCHEGVHAP